MIKTTIGGPAAILCLLLAGTASAAPPPSRAPVVQSVLDCRKVEDGPARLACYDKAVDGMAQAEAKGDLVTIDREQRRAVRRQVFGLNVPSFTLFDRGEKPDEVNRLNAKVAEAFRNHDGKWVIKLEDGARWRQIDDNDLFRTPHEGSTADIMRGAIGSFFMKLDGQQAIRVHRDN